MIDSLNSPYIQAADADTFAPLVLENSGKGPVLVNFWSKKAGPCLRLYPLLDKLVHEYDGRVLLVNVDADREVGITKDYGVASVPTLKLFRKGRVVETRHGFQSEQDLVKMLQHYIARDSDQAIAGAVRLYGEGKQEDAYQLLVDTILEDPVNPRLPLALAKLFRHEGRYQDAINLLDALPEGVGDYDETKQFRALLGFQAEADGRDSTTLARELEDDPGNPALQRQFAVQLVVEGAYAQALALMAVLLDSDAAIDKGALQQDMLRVFAILEEDHPLRQEYRSYVQRYMH